MLSGGEKARLVMAKMLFDPPNFLVLDEPTNHLDMATKEMLVAALAEFEGTMLFVSHDRHFLAALSNRVLELTAGEVHQYAGGYTEYVARTGRKRPACTRAVSLLSGYDFMALPKCRKVAPDTVNGRNRITHDGQQAHSGHRRLWKFRHVHRRAVSARTEI